MLEIEGAEAKGKKKEKEDILATKRSSLLQFRESIEDQ